MFYLLQHLPHPIKLVLHQPSSFFLVLVIFFDRQINSLPLPELDDLDLENLMMVPGNQFGENLLYSWFKNSVVKKQEEQIRAKAVEVINFLNLTHLTQELAGNLSGGQKKLLELGRTMMVDAKLVLLDEVGAGVNRTLLNEISDAIIRLNKEKDYTFFVIEHDMDLIEKICDPVIVMAEGSVLFQGSFDEVKSNDEVIEAYLGRGMKKRKH